MKTFLCLAGISLFFCNSCRKDPEITFELPYEPDSIKIVTSPGSWWKYEWYEIDSLGNENYLAEQDCLYVVGDTMINGKTFTHYTGDNYTFSQPLNWFWRDSSHYLIDQTGRLQFSTHSEIDTLGTFEGPFYNVNYLTDGIEHAITVPAGTFNSYVHESHYHNLNGTPYTACDSIFVKTRSFSNGVGIITEQSGYIFQIQKECKYWEKRLTEYYIAE